MSHIVYFGHNPREISAYQTTKDRQQTETQVPIKPVLVKEKSQQTTATINVEFERRTGEDRRQQDRKLNNRFDSRCSKDRRQKITLIY